MRALQSRSTAKILFAGFVLFSISISPSRTGGLSAQTAHPATQEHRHFEEAVSKFMAATAAPGVSAAVVENAQEVWSGGFGKADLENSVSATSDTLYRLGSVSKPITATAAMELWERGKLDLDAPVEKYCPAFPPKQWPITTRELLGHLGGIRHYKASEDKADLANDLEIDNTRHFDDSIAGGLQFFASDPLVAQPGTQFHYSTQGFTLVGCAIEGASGETYVNFVRQNVFAPAAMNHTQPDDHYRIISHRTRFYRKDESGKVENAGFLDSSYKIPGGGWLSSVDDLAQFEIALLADHLLEPATREIMWTRQKTTDGKPTSYGLGWGVGSTDGVPDVDHSGGQQGTSTFIMIVPERRAGVVVLANMEGVDAGALASQLMKIALGAPAADPVK
ncbi:MAG TPA: serine hydrolase domain-containing protein [Candidatus Cybelea sp.]|nr:serine hydrolase domain-containing protein [Candidatus Cybelea sp.]